MSSPKSNLVDAIGLAGTQANEDITPLSGMYEVAGIYEVVAQIDCIVSEMDVVAQIDDIVAGIVSLGEVTEVTEFFGMTWKKFMMLLCVDMLYYNQNNVTR